MKNGSKIRALVLLICGSAAALAVAAPALAEGSGGHGGGGHVSGAGHVAYGGGFHGGYGWHGGWGGYGWRGCCGWGWGWGGVGLGLYFATLPLYYSTYFWGGVPYYYADNVYYRWDGTVGQYVTVSPPTEVQSQAATQPAASSELIAYPKNGQSTEQQGKDKYECHRWAAAQSGFDPTQANTAPAVAPGNGRTDYMRAQAACLEGRGYSVR